MGAGDSGSIDDYNTPGFEFTPDDIIEFDKRGFKIIKIKRIFSKRFNQYSMLLLQSWRANCDIKIILYHSHPVHPDIREIANVIDYVVSYICKGNHTLAQEREIITSAIQRYVWSQYMREA